MVDVTAELHNVKFVNLSADAKIAWGNVIGDSKRRFVDGTRIHTSLILKIEGDLIHTLNSVYRIVGEYTEVSREQD